MTVIHPDAIPHIHRYGQLLMEENAALRLILTRWMQAYSAKPEARILADQTSKALEVPAAMVLGGYAPSGTADILIPPEI